MSAYTRLVSLAALSVCLGDISLFAQTDGSAKLETTINDYVGTSGTKHWTVVWVTTQSGAFIKTVWIQGNNNNYWATHWNNHCGQWYTARAGSTALDGYSSATAQTYTGTNSPVILRWNCRDASNALLPDGNYKFWVQYAEDSGQGPYTTSGLLWTKGPAGATNSYSNQSTNFTNMKVTWTPSAPPSFAPVITSAPPTGTGTVGVPYAFSCSATGSVPISFSAAGLPPGLAISTAGVISGTPTTAGTFNGTITAANGTLPNATQACAIVISVVPTSFTALHTDGSRLVLSGTGPANGTYTVLTSTNASLPVGQWTATSTQAINGSGQFSFTNLINPNTPQQFIRLRLP